MIKNQMYREIYGHLLELGIRLNCKSETICTAIIYFYRLSERGDYIKRSENKYAIARACLCEAGAFRKDTANTAAQDVYNVSNKILFPDFQPTSIADERTAGRMKEFDDARKLVAKPSFQFESAPKTHGHLTRFLSQLRDFQPRLFEKYEMERLCTIVLQDMYICPSIIWTSSGEVIAALAINFILKFLAPDITTEDFLRNVCPKVDRYEMKKLRRFVSDHVYML